MASPCKQDPCDMEEAPQDLAATSQDSQQVDYDFVEQPSQNFFCPVTFELLIEPQQTTCCGNHLSQEAANRLQRDGKPCPMCKETQLTTMPDKFFKRMVYEIKVRCPHTKSGCEWVGGVNEVKQHSDSCPKRPWQCQYCDFASTYDIGISKHVPKCTKYPVVCPNSCEIGSVPRCDLEAHLTVCPLEPVVCEYAEVGCDVKVPRRDLARHMEESQQQHLLSATLLNLRLTRENTDEKNRLLRMIEKKDNSMQERDKTISDLQTQVQQVQVQNQILKEKEAQSQKQLAIAEQNIMVKDEALKESVQQLKKKEEEFKIQLAAKDQYVEERDKTISDLQKQLKQVQESLEAKVADLQQQIVKYGEDTQEHLKQQDKYIEYVSLQQGYKDYEQHHLYIQQGFTIHEFTLTEFKKYQAQGRNGDWYSEPFYSHPGGFKFRLNVETNGTGEDQGVYMRVWFKLLTCNQDKITVTAHVQLLNQLGNHSHHEMNTHETWNKGTSTTVSSHFGGRIARFIKLADLGLSADKKTQYLKNDCLQFRIYIKATKN